MLDCHRRRDDADGPSATSSDVSISLINILRPQGNKCKIADICHVLPCHELVDDLFLLSNSLNPSVPPRRGYPGLELLETDVGDCAPDEALHSWRCQAIKQLLRQREASGVFNLDACILHTRLGAVWLKKSA